MKKWEWEWDGMGIDSMGMGGSGNVKSHSRSSLIYNFNSVINTCFRISKRLHKIGKLWVDFAFYMLDFAS